MAAASKHSKEQINEDNEVIKLYQDCKTERFDTARCVVNSLSSKGLQKPEKTGLAKLKYRKKYASRLEQYFV